MTAGRYDIYIEQGSKKTIVIEFLNSDNTPINLTGFKFRMQMRPYVTSPVVQDELTDDNGRILVEPEIGRIGLDYPSAVTSAYTFVGKNGCSSVYDLEWFESGEAKRKLEGNVTISPEVTKIDTE